MAPKCVRPDADIVRYISICVKYSNNLGTNSNT